MQETRRIKLSEIKPKEKEAETMIDEMKQDAVMGLIEGFIPKIAPMIEKASSKLEEYFGDDEKVFLIRRSAGQKPQVIVLSNLKGYYEISNTTKVEGTGENAELVVEKTFRAHKNAIIDVHDTGAFVTKLLNGEFAK